MACFFHGDEQSAAPPIRDSHSLGCISLRPPSVLGPLQPLQPVPFFLAHRDSFHPPAHRLSRGTFYFAQLGTYHFAATLEEDARAIAARFRYASKHHSLREATTLAPRLRKLAPFALPP